VNTFGKGNLNRLPFCQLPKYIHAIMHCLWPANVLAGSHFWAQEIRALSPDGVCTLARLVCTRELLEGATFRDAPMMKIRENSGEA